MKLLSVTILSLVLLSEAILARYLTGSALHLVLLLIAAALFAGLRLVGPVPGRTAGFAGSLLVAFGAMYLVGKRFVMVAYAELPAVFDLAVGVHFLVWTLAIGEARRKGSRRPASRDATPLDPPWLVAAVAAGTAIAWTTGTVEVYTTSELLVRSLGFGVLGATILLVHRSTVMRSGSSIASPAGRHWKSAAWLLAASAAAIVLAALLVRPAQGLAGQLYVWFDREENTSRLGEFGGSRPALRTGSGGGNQAGRELPKKADIELDNTLRFYVELDNRDAFDRLTRNGEVYTRTSTLSVFAEGGVLAPLRSYDWRYDGDDGLEDGRISRLGADPEPPGSVTYSVLIDRRDSRAVPIVPGTQSIGLTSIYAYADDWFQLALDEYQDRVRFRATSIQRTVSDLLEAGEPIAFETPADAYRELPLSALSERVRLEAYRLIPSTKDRGVSNPEHTLREVRQWLRNQCAYSLRYENPNDLDPVENFLFEEKQGHCELFAAGTVMMLRSLGVPSRVAYGYCGGTMDPDKHVLAFRESDFHAWAEVHLENHGWVIFETTPPGEGAVRLAEIGTGNPLFADDNLAGYEFIGEFEPVEMVEISLVSRLARRVTEFVSDWFFAICGLGIGIVVLVAWLKRRGGTGTARDSGGTIWPGGGRGGRERPPDFVADYLGACRELGFEKRLGQTWLEFLHTLKQAGICHGEFDDLTDYIYAIRYAGQERSDFREQQFRDLVRYFSESRN